VVRVSPFRGVISTGESGLWNKRASISATRSGRRVTSTPAMPENGGTMTKAKTEMKFCLWCWDKGVRKLTPHTALWKGQELPACVRHVELAREMQDLCG
jgi:hypothetical protein